MAEYTYDSRGQLIRAVENGVTTDYTYDTAGNLLTKGSNSYTYGSATWRDQLTAYNGEPITYDGVGNPLSYYNGTRSTMTWAKGRQLASYTDADDTVSYTYDMDGIRSSKTVDGVKHTYVTQNGKVVRESYGSTVLDFIYDQNGSPYALNYSTNSGSSFTTYYYLTNLQGDVVRIVSSTGAAVANYTYDAWGAVVSATGAIATINPIRYRGYYYDTESGFYYLQSRYYDPVVGRFICADDPEVLSYDLGSFLQYNFYAYCWNNPVGMMDVEGDLPWFIGAAITGALIDTATYVITAAICRQDITWSGIGKSLLTGAISGVAFGAIGKGVKAVSNAVKTGRAAKTIKYTTGTANQIGQVGEKISGIAKNKTKYFINGRWRIPDGITKKYIQEVKNVKSLSLTSQLKDSIQLAKNTGRRLQLYIRRDTYLTKPLRDAIREHNIKVTYLW